MMLITSELRHKFTFTIVNVKHDKMENPGKSGGC